MIGGMRVVALLAVHNEERFLPVCLDHLAAHGVETYVIDNDSTDASREIAEERRGNGVIGIEALPRDGSFCLSRQLQRKEELAATLDADWFIHLDADEIRVPGTAGTTLAQELASADAAGYNAVAFQE